MRRRALLTACAVLVGRAAAAAAAPAPPPPVIYVSPLGDELPAADVAAVREALVGFYAADVRVLSRAPLPAAAYTKPRRRWRAEKLLAYLRGVMPTDGTRILGLTGADISTTKDRFEDWGVMGLGEEPGLATVISSFRCRKKARDAAHARQRLAKVAVHEIGHSLGLDHCPTQSCLMHDAQGKVVTVDDEYDLCPRCRARLAAAGHPIPDAPAIPWPRPR
jgi:archaemetzincin